MKEFSFLELTILKDLTGRSRSDLEKNLSLILKEEDYIKDSELKKNLLKYYEVNINFRKELEKKINKHIIKKLKKNS